MTTITDPTAEILAAMLVENTGIAMMDSGGASGRAWQHNQGQTVETLRTAPATTVETGAKYERSEDGTWGGTGETVISYVTVDVFHFLAERCEYEADLDAALHAFADRPENEGESWFAIRDEWLTEIGAVGGIDHSGSPNVVNTYNGEDALSQTIEYALFDLPDDRDETYVVLMVHGGADVRGGYTAPRVFSLGRWNSYSLFDNARFTAVLNSPDGKRSVVLDYDGRSEADNRENQPHDDDSLDEIDFVFEETPIVAPGDGDTEYVIAAGPAKGWTISFHEWPAG